MKTPTENPLKPSQNADPDMPLSKASVGDMAAELRRRGLAFALIAQAHEGGTACHGLCWSEDPTHAYGLAKHLCDQIGVELTRRIQASNDTLGSELEGEA